MEDFVTATLPFPPLRPGPDGGPAPVRRRRPELSDREIEVLAAWLVADTKREVTERLFISDSTVSTHIQRVRSKYESVGRPARTKTHLLVRALEDGIVGIDDF